MVTTVLKSFNIFFIIATTSSSITLSLTGFSLIVIPSSSGITCGLTISNKLICEINIQKYNKYKEQYQKTNKQLNLSIICIEKVYKIT